jgi:hypothetical protein
MIPAFEPLRSAIVIDTNMKQLENGKKILEVFVGNTNRNILDMNGSPISIEGKWRLKCKRLGYEKQEPFTDPP